MLGPLESALSARWRGCAHTRTGRAWPTRTREKGAPTDGVAFSCARALEQSKLSPSSGSECIPPRHTPSQLALEEEDPQVRTLLVLSCAARG
jgi:hypothetical protein